MGVRPRPSLNSAAVAKLVDLVRCSPG